MKIEISHFDNQDPRYQDCLKLRLDILRRPLGMEILPSDLEKDKDSMHILLTVDAKPAGTVCLRGNNLRQMAVSEDFRGLKLGSKLLEYLETIADSNEILTEARDYAVPFYEKNGYISYDEPYEHIGIIHQKMKKAIR